MIGTLICEQCGAVMAATTVPSISPRIRYLEGIIPHDEEGRVVYVQTWTCGDGHKSALKSPEPIV